MPDPTASAIAVTATGLSILGIATGLQPDILLAGFAGGLWAQTYLDAAPFLRRVTLLVGSPIVAGYLSPLVFTLIHSSLPNETAREVATNAIAFLIGLTAMRVLGPALMRLAEKKADEVTHD